MTTKIHHEGHSYSVTDTTAHLLGHVPGWGHTRTAVTDPALLATLLAERAAQIAERDAFRAEAAQGRRTFVRMGAIPVSGRSYNHMDNHSEAGVSVYAAWVTDEMVYIDCTETASTYLMFGEDRPLYEVAGTLLDETGGDDEPLLAGASVVRELTQDWVVVK